MQTYLIATETFRGLVLAQARARKIDAKLLVVKHPIGGLNAEELAERITAASAELQRQIKAA